jgi:DNA-binding winged helix-turn-helix (wHTH) protein
VAQQISEAANPVVLGRAEPFRVGAIDVVPATRQILREGASETLEPRVMQVLVALAEAKGAIVTRDELIDRCWDGRIVGDNAIHRVVSRLRLVAATFGEGSFAIETIARVGYRLLAEGSAASPAKAPSRRAAAAVAAVAAAAAVAALIVWATHRAEPASPSFAIAAADPGDAASADLARGLSVELARLPALAARGPLLVEAGHARFQIRVAVRPAGKGPRLDLSLAARGGPLLWSAKLERAASADSDFRVQAGSKLVGVLPCAAAAEAARPRLDTGTLRLYLAACDKLRDGAEDQATAEAAAMLRQVAARRPSFAPALAALALLDANALDEGSPDYRRQRAAMLGEIRRARALDPLLAETYAAEAALIRYPGGWRERLALIDRGLAADANSALLHNERSDQLSRLGRLQEALREARRASLLDPLSADDSDSLIRLLAAAGNLDEARRELDVAEHVWPGTRTVRLGRYAFELRYGDPKAALRYQDQPDLFDFGNPPTSGPFGLYLRARLDPSPSNVDAAIAAFLARRSFRISGLIQTLGEFGRVDEAYRLFGRPALLRELAHATDVLFRPGMASFRRDRRFIPLAAKLGLVGYWRESGVWPDFCLDPQLPYDCSAEADKLAAR